jgi:hypothetical protein
MRMSPPSLRSPRYVTPGPVTDYFDKKGSEVTTGIGPRLDRLRAELGRLVVRREDRSGAARDPRLAIGVRAPILISPDQALSASS